MYTLLHEAQFVDANTGFIVGGTDFGNWNIFLKTTNGGETWQNMNAAASLDTSFPARITEISFLTNQIGFIARGQGENKIYRTTNGGTSFTVLDLPINSQVNLTEMCFINPYVGFITRMQTSDHINSTTEILKQPTEEPRGLL